ncbi:hypothetical protein C2U70_15060 [Bradyrhizobium guangdongense]|uniref:DUF6719 family protein n=1 Tax=Bradyrhizobium guangdongense TaxID=1325090 RepID=UPI00112EA438|nr:DUF6719 family protein [Bradyrhizobium guangdongense]TPQ35234.1 hypothetical protein C2U70_15060 [Bradyrhizobium guangdongense]
MLPVRTLCLAALLAMIATSSVHAQTVGREQDIPNLRLGQRALVDDGTCPAGQIKEVRGSKMTGSGILVTRTCVPRIGPKTK